MLCENMIYVNLRLTQFGKIAKKYEESVSSGICGSSTKKLWQWNYENLEKVLVLWIKQVCSENVVIDGPILKEKAQMFVKELGYENWGGSID